MLAEIDDFAEGVAKTSANEELMRFLEERSKEKGHISLAEVRKQLGLKPAKRRKS